MSEQASPLEPLFEATFTELRAVASRYLGQERRGHTLQPTALVHEAYLRLQATDGITFNGRTHFLNLASAAMRRVLVDHARRKHAEKRGGNRVQVTLHDIGVAGFPDETCVLEFDRALQNLETIDERGARVVELRVFTGLTMEEIAATLGVTRRTVQTDWRVATMWLRRELAMQAEG
jgi:RNA polymerase sigma-70 factor, ECF subfamily